jgi:lipoate-protein ligase A
MRNEAAHSVEPWRLVVHGAGDGAWNMAVDEAILRGYVDSGAAKAPTLRLYTWRPPTLSLGKGQSPEIGPDLRYLEREGIDLVRRPTGGRAVLHARERTYAVIGAAESPFSGRILETYLQVARALEEALRRLGLRARIAPPTRPCAGGGAETADAACFGATSAHEITVDGKKIVGSAQLRGRGAFLQHGSIPIRGAGDRLARALGDEGPGEERATDLSSCLGREPSFEEIDRALVEGFAVTFSRELRPGGLTEREAGLAARLRCWKYDSAEWTLLGRLGRRERRWGRLRP